MCKDCHDTIITFKNGTPDPGGERSCPYHDNGEHNWIPAGTGSNWMSAIGNAIMWIGFGVGFVSAAIAFFKK